MVEAHRKILKKDQISVLAVYEKWVEEDRDAHLDFVKLLKRKVDELYNKCLDKND